MSGTPAIVSKVSNQTTKPRLVAKAVWYLFCYIDVTSAVYWVSDIKRNGCDMISKLHCASSDVRKFNLVRRRRD